MARRISSSETKRWRPRRTAEPAKREPARRAIASRFESAFTNAPIGMALADRNGLPIEVNAAFSRITGYSRGELETVTLRSLIHPDDVDLDAQLRITASVGVALLEGLSPGEPLAHADFAMYEAKTKGRDRFAVYHRPMPPVLDGPPARIRMS